MILGALGLIVLVRLTLVAGRLTADAQPSGNVYRVGFTTGGRGFSLFPSEYQLTAARAGQESRRHPMIRLRLEPPFTRIVGAKEIVDIDQGPLWLVLERALALNAKLQRAVLDPAGRLSSEYACSANGDRCNLSDLGDVEVDATDEITLLLPLAGGG